LQGDGDEGIKIVYGEEKSILYWLDKPNESTKEGLLSIVLFESPSPQFQQVSRGHPSLVLSLVVTQ
jgi:hypothetical protein